MGLGSRLGAGGLGHAVTAAIAEIDENLIRRDLSPAMRADLTARRKELYERQFPEAPRGKGGDRKSTPKSSVDGFASQVSKTTGQSVQKVRLDAQRGKAIGSARLKRVAGTSLDKGTELDALAKLPDAQYGRA